MQPKPWVPPCVLFGWCFSPWKLWGGVWLVDIVVPSMGLQTPSAPSVLSLTPPLGSQGCVQWLAWSIYLCICQALAEPLKRQLYQDPVTKHFLASTIVSEFGACICDESLGGAVSGGLSFSLCSTFCPCISFRQGQFWVKIYEMGGCPHPSTRGCVYPLDTVSIVSLSLLLGILANVLPVGS